LTSGFLTITMMFVKDGSAPTTGCESSPTLD
jgi:hypothetical protein